MRLIFKYPDNLESLDITLATKAYEQIWQTDGQRIVELFNEYTGLVFKQENIEVIIHNGQSMSGKDGVPMRLNSSNDSIVKKRGALIHELGHRLLFGNGLYASDENNQDDNDEIRVLLFQGDVIRDLYGEADYESWSELNLDNHAEDYIKDLRHVLSLSKIERNAKLKTIIGL